MKPSERIDLLIHKRIADSMTKELALDNLPLSESNAFVLAGILDFLDEYIGDLGFKDNKWAAIFKNDMYRKVQISIHMNDDLYKKFVFLYMFIVNNIDRIIFLALIIFFMLPSIFYDSIQFICL